MEIKKDCNNCEYYSKENVCLRSEVCETKDFEYWESKQPFNRCNVTNIIIDPCPLVLWCPTKTAVCNVMQPDEGCYWYRYFRDLIKETEP